MILEIPGDNLRLSVRTRWQEGANCGVQFAERIAHPVLTAYRRRNNLSYRDMVGAIS
jgi:hypothetical protein